MKFDSRKLCNAIIAAVIGVSPAASQPQPAPIVVELFTSEGCSSCPPADALLQKLAAGEHDVIALGEHVDYWDHQGWKDRFGSPAFSRRQQDYATRFNNETIYTPQMVVDGRIEFVGSDAAAAKRALQQARTTPHAAVDVVVQAQSRGLHVTITAANLPKLSPREHADIVLVVTEDSLQSDVKRGENSGRVLSHVAVVRYLATAGEASTTGSSTVQGEIALGADWQRPNLNVVAFVQERGSRKIIGAAAARPDRR